MALASDHRLKAKVNIWLVVCTVQSEGTEAAYLVELKKSR